MSGLLAADDDDAALIHFRLSFRKRLERYLATSSTGLFWDVFIAVLSVFAIMMYIWESYETSASGWYSTVELVLSAFFAADYVLRVYLSEHRLALVVSWPMVVDLATILPVVIEIWFESSTLRFFTFLRTLKVLRLVRIQRMFAYIESEVTQHISKMLLTIVSIIFLASGLVQVVEEDQELPFHEVLYFTVVTITTVGYGDISPQSGYGQLVVSLMILATVVLVPRQTNELLRLLSLQSVFATKEYTMGDRHVLVLGSINQKGNLGAFVSEFFHPDHSSFELHHAVILAPFLPPADVEMLLRDAKYQLVLTYLEGSPMVSRDLRRAAAARASAVFVLCNKFASDAEAMDAASILRALAVRRYVQERGASVMTCIQLIKPESAAHFHAAGVRAAARRRFGAQAPAPPQESRLARARRFLLRQPAPAARQQYVVPKDADDVVICISEMKMKLLAKSTLCPGLCTLLSNLIGSSGADSNEGNWISEYQTGGGYEVYLVPLSPAFEGLSFSEVARRAHRIGAGTLMALELVGKPGEEPRIALNPGAYVLPNVRQHHVKGFIIAEDISQAELATLYDAATDAAPGPSGGGGKPATSRVVVAPAAAAAGNTTEDDDPTDDPAGDRPKRNSGARRPSHALRRAPSSLAAAAAKTAKPAKKPSRWQQLRSTQAPVSDAEAASLKYFTLEEPDPLEAATRDYVTLSTWTERMGSLPPERLRQGHVILCGNVSNVDHFVRPLRDRHLSRIRPLVILHPDPIPPVVWGRIAMFPLVFVVRGSPLETDDLVRAGAHSAARAVVLTESMSDDAAANQPESLVDAGTIFACKGLKALNPSIVSVAEVVSHTNVGFLDDDLGQLKAKHYTLSPAYAAGTVYSSSLNDLIMAQSFYNPRLVKLIAQVVAGENIVSARKWNERHAATAGAITSSAIFQIPVPDHLIGATWEVLFRDLVADHVLPIALYRGVIKAIGAGVKGNVMPYVCTSPAPDAVIESIDKVFVLAQSQPETAEWDTASQAQTSDVLLQAVQSTRNMPRMAQRRFDDAQQAMLKAIKGVQAAITADVAALRDDVNARLTALEQAVGAQQHNPVVAAAVLPLAAAPTGAAAAAAVEGAVRRKSSLPSMFGPPHSVAARSPTARRPSSGSSGRSGSGSSGRTEE